MWKRLEATLFEKFVEKFLYKSSWRKKKHHKDVSVYIFSSNE